MWPGARAANWAAFLTRMDVSRSRKVGKGHRTAGFVRNRFQKVVENSRKNSKNLNLSSRGLALCAVRLRWVVIISARVCYY